MVAAAVAAGEAVVAQAPHAQVSLVFAVPVVAAAARFRLATALLTAALAVGGYDFFFTRPLYSLQVDDAADLTTLAVLVVVAGVVSAVAARARREARNAHAAARRSGALHDLASAVLRGSDGSVVLATAASTLRRLSGRPALFATVETGAVRTLAESGLVKLSFDDQEALRFAARERRHVPAGAYPFFGSSYDFWPTRRDGLVVGVRLWHAQDRARLTPEDLDQVLGYVAGGGPGPMHGEPTGGPLRS